MDITNDVEVSEIKHERQSLAGNYKFEASVHMAHIGSDMSISENEKETILWKGRKFGNAPSRKTNGLTSVAKVGNPGLNWS